MFNSCYSNDTNCGDLPGHINTVSYTGLAACESHCNGYVYFGVQTCSGYSFVKNLILIIL